MGEEIARKALSMQKCAPFATHALGQIVSLIPIHPVLIPVHIAENLDWECETNSY